MDPKRSLLERVLKYYTDETTTTADQSETYLMQETDQSGQPNQDTTLLVNNASYKKWDKMSTQSILFSVFFFLVHGATNVLNPYLSVYYKQLGADAQQIGIITSVQSWVAIPFTPLTGYLADKFSIQKLVLAGSLVGAAASHLALNFVPNVRNVDCTLLTNLLEVSIEDHGRPLRLVYENSTTCMQELQDENHTDAQVSSNGSNLPNDYIKIGPEYTGYLYNPVDLQRVFIYLVLVNIVCQLVGGAWYPLGNAAILDALGPENRNQYAYFKGFGAISNALCVWLAGLLLQVTAFSVTICGVTLNNVNYLVCFASFGVMMLLAVPVAMAVSPNQSERSTKEFRIAEVLQALCNLRYGSVVFVITWLAIANGKMRTFDYWYIQVLGGSHSLMAWAGLIGESSMIVAFFILPKINDKFGHIIVVILACVATGIGCGISGFITNPTWMILTLFIRETTLAMYIQASGAYLAEAIESHQMATMQTIMAALTFGVGRGVGSLLGGGLFGAITPAVSYYIFALVSFAMALFLIIIHVTLKAFSK